MRNEKISRVCKMCGKGFKTWICTLKRGGETGSFCSLKCSGAGRKYRPQRSYSNYICEECNKPFTRNRTGKYKYKYCSMTCVGKVNSRSRAGENHPNWKGGVAKRTKKSYIIAKIIVFQKGKCEKCGSTENLHGHHVRPYSTYPELREEPTNIQVLCSGCHAKEHPNYSSFITKIKSGKEISCLVCGTKRYVMPSEFKTAKYCSKKCKGKTLTKEWKGRENVQRKQKLDSWSGISAGLLSFGC